MMKEKLDILFFAPPMYIDGSIPREKLADDNKQGRDIPRGPLCIASFLRTKKFGARVVVPDSFFSQPIGSKNELHKKVNELILQKVLEYDPRFIGFSMMFGFIEKNVLEMTRFIKRNFPDRVVIVGGNHASFIAERLLSSKYDAGIDVVVRGEGERIVEELLSGKDWHKILGISFRDKRGCIFHNEDRVGLSILDFPAIDFSLMDIGKNVDLANFNHIVQFARGCSFDCAFCTNKRMWGRRVRFVNLQRFRKELDDVLMCYDKLSSSHPIIFADDDVFTHKKYWEFLFPILEEAKAKHPKVSFVVQARVSALYRDTDHIHKILTWAQKVNIVSIFLGIESCSDTILEAMNKKYNFDQVRKALINIRKYNILIGAFWMFGHPGATVKEEEISYFRFKRILSEGLLDILELHTTFPFPGSAIRKDPRLKILVSEYEEADKYSLFEEYPIHCLVDPCSGRVVMSQAQIAEAHRKALEIKNEYLGENHAVVDLDRVL